MNSETQVHFCTFGSLPHYARSLDLLCREAEESGYFSTVNRYTQENIPATKEEMDFMASNPRGYGYWIWKPIVMLDMFSRFPEGDIVAYADAGCGISTTPEARSNMEAWIRDCVEHPTHRLSFQMPHLEERYTKADVFQLMEADDERFKKTGQFIGCIQFMMICKNNFDFLSKWKLKMSQKKYHYVSDKLSEIKNPENFVDHRHDQSILSIMLKKMGSSERPDHWNNYSFPIVVIRRK